MQITYVQCAGSSYKCRRVHMGIIPAFAHSEKYLKKLLKKNVCLRQALCLYVELRKTRVYNVVSNYLNCFWSQSKCDISIKITSPP